MNHFFENIVLPIHHVVSGRHIRAHLLVAQSREWLSSVELCALQAQGLRRLIAHTYANVPFYRQRFSESGLTPDDVKTPEDLSRIPLLTKDDLRRQRDKLIATNYPQKHLVSRSTGGSTGKPTTFFYDRDSWDARVAAGYMAYRCAGWDFGVRRAILSGSPIEKKVFSSLRGRLKSLAFREIFLDTFEMDERRRREYIDRLQKFRPRVLYGYVSSCAALAKQIIQDDRYLSIPSIVTSAEMLFPADRDLIESAFHGRVFNLYGSREITAIAMECSSHIGMHCSIDRIVLEVLQDNKPAAPGESGEIVLTDLQNYGMPFIRYKIGDVGRILKERCPCGREMPLIELTQGRICDMIITPEGKYLPGEFFPHLFKEVSRQVEQFQVLQERVDELIITIVPAASYGQAQTEYLLAKIQEKTGSRMTIAFRFVKEIPPEQSGKHRVTISTLPRASAFEPDAVSEKSPQ